MANDSIITNKGKNTILYRAYTQTGSLSSTQYNPIEKFQLGILNDTPDITDTSLTSPVPISNGTVNDDGDNQLTGSSGGDNTTDNTTTYKEGASAADNTAQNLIKNSSNATAVWTISDLSSAGTNIDTSKYCGLWLYIKDSTAYDKLLTSGTAVQVKLGSDSSNYYSISFTASQLSNGWNWLTSSSIVSSWDETGTVGTPVDTFIIEATTNNATDTLAAGDLVYDLLRTWTDADTKKDFVSGFPSIDFTNNEVTTRAYVTTLEASGYDINAMGFLNTDTTPLLLEEDVFTAESKSNTDEFTFIVKTRIL